MHRTFTVPIQKQCGELPDVTADWLLLLVRQRPRVPQFDFMPVTTGDEVLPRSESNTVNRFAVAPHRYQFESGGNVPDFQCRLHEWTRRRRKTAAVRTEARSTHI